MKDSEVLNMIEDFIVNNFGEDEREQTSDSECRDMLVHIMDNLLEQRDGHK